MKNIVSWIFICTIPVVLLLVLLIQPEWAERRKCVRCRDLDTPSGLSVPLCRKHWNEWLISLRD